MASTCTLFSVTDADIAPAEVMLPSISDRTSVVSATIGRPHIVELGEAWVHLHAALGGHPADNPLGFLAAGGSRFAALDDGASSIGRHFGPAATVKMLAAVARVTEDELMRSIASHRLAVPSVAELMRLLVKLRVFLAEAVTSDRGVIVHTIG